MKSAAYLAASAQTLIAAGTFLVAKDANNHFPSLHLGWFRIVIASLLFTAVYSITHRRAPVPPRSDLRTFLFLGLMGVTTNQMLFLFGIGLSTPLHASLIYAFTPVLVLGGALMFLGERFTGLKGIGVILAVTGVGLVLSAQGLDLAHGPLRGDLLILLAVFAWAGYTLAGKDMLRRYDPFTVTAWSFAFGGLSMLPLAFRVLPGFDFAGPGWKGWLEVLYLSAITSGVAFTLWYFALKRLEATQVAIFTNLQAPLTALLAWWIFGSVPAAKTVLGGVLVLMGVTVVQVRIPRRRARVQDSASRS